MAWEMGRWPNPQLVVAAVGPVTAQIDRSISQLRQEEFKRLQPSTDHPQGITPLDHAGTALYSEKQLHSAFEEMQTQLLCNPHSASQPGSLATLQRAALARYTLAMCNASSDQYEVVLTSGATAAMKLVSESLPWGPTSCLAHCLSTHNSVLGMREVVLAAGGAVQVVQPVAVPNQTAQGQPAVPCLPQAGTCVQLQACAPPLRREVVGTSPDAGSSSRGNPAVHLAVLPHECNFTGQQLDLNLVNEIQAGQQLQWLLPGPAADTSNHVLSGDHTVGPGAPSAQDTTAPFTQSSTAGSHQGHPASPAAGASGVDGVGGSAVPWGPRGRWLVLLDAAKSCATSPPDLQRHPADIVALSYYKIMGYPTGLGALIVRKDVLPLLTAHKAYFGGGTVAVSVADQDYMVRRPGAAGLEDGTPAFTAISAACHGFRFLERLGGFAAVSSQARALADYLAQELRALRHANGQPLVVVYGREPGTPGVVQWGPTVAFNLKRPDGSWVGYTEVSRLADLHGIQLRTGCFCNPGACAQYLGLSGAEMRENHEAGHVCWDERDILRGKPTGAVRVSLGHVSCFRDVHFFLGFIRHYFLDQPAYTTCLPSPAASGAEPMPVASMAPYSVAPTISTVPMTSAADTSPDTNPSTVKPKPDAATSNGNGNGVPSQSNLPPATATPWLAGTAQEPMPTSHQSASTSQPPASQHQSTSSQPEPISQYQPAMSQPAPVSQNQPASSQLVLDTAEANGRTNGLTSGHSIGNSVPVDSASPSIHHDSHAPASSPEQPHGPLSGHAGASRARLAAMYVYPIKSCAAQQVTRWPVGPTGLLYDREWALVDDSGRVVTQKGCPHAALIAPHIDLTARTLTITAPNASQPLVVPLDPSPGSDSHHPVQHTAAQSSNGHNGIGMQPSAQGLVGQGLGGSGLAHVSVCGDSVCGSVVAASVGPVNTDQTGGDAELGHMAAGVDAARGWFKAALGLPCILVQQRGGERVARAGTGGTGRPAKGHANRQDPLAAAGKCPNATTTPEATTPEAGGSSVNGEGGMRPVSSAAQQAAHIGFANDGQYLLVNASSVEDVNARIRATKHAPGVAPAQPVELLRFRPNFVVEGLAPYAEDAWTAVQVGRLHCHVLGTCPRCEMLQVDQTSGTRGRPDVLLALAQYRRFNGRMHFGILLSADNHSTSQLATGAAAPGLGTGSGSGQGDAGYLELCVGDEVVGN